MVFIIIQGLESAWYDALVSVKVCEVTLENSMALHACQCALLNHAYDQQLFLIISKSTQIWHHHTAHTI